LTCAMEKCPQFKKVISKMTQAEFLAQVILGGAPITEPLNAGGQALRQYQGDLWKSLHEFWGQSQVKHLASVLALCLEGHGHGKLQVPVISLHNGCAGKWDMYATWAAYELNMFPAKWVRACSIELQDQTVCSIVIALQNL